MNYTMRIGIIIWMIWIFPAAFAMEGPIRRQASQSEKTVPIGGNVTLMCPLVPDDLWEYVYWKKNDHTIYSLEVKSNTTWTNDTRYEGSNHATRLTIKDLKKTDSGLYHCKVVTLFSIKERGHVLLSVTDQEVGLSTTSSGVPLTASTTKPTQPAEDNPINLVLFICFPIISIFITVCLVFKYRKRKHRKRNRNLRAEYVTHTQSAFKLRPTPRRTPPPLPTDFSHHEFRDKEGTQTNLLGSDTHGRDDADVDERPEERNASQSLEGTQTNLLGSDTHGRDDVDVDDRPEEWNAFQSLKIFKTDDVTI